MLFDLEEELKKLPASPGVYLMHNNRDEIIYVGKAISLKNRVRQYFQSSRNKTAKIQQMVSHIAWFEYILTDSELEALVLECNLIKEHRPRYNTMLKDDKTYPYIKATIWEDFPRLLFSRDMKKDGRSRYFGPYTSAGAVKDSLDPQAVPHPHLQPQSAKRYGKRAALFKLSHPSVRCSLPGIYFKRRVPGVFQRGTGLFRGPL